MPLVVNVTNELWLPTFPIKCYFSLHHKFAELGVRNCSRAMTLNSSNVGWSAVVTFCTSKYQNALCSSIREEFRSRFEELRMHDRFPTMTLNGSDVTFCGHLRAISFFSIPMLVAPTTLLWLISDRCSESFFMTH